MTHRGTDILLVIMALAALTFVLYRLRRRQFLPLRKAGCLPPAKCIFPSRYLPPVRNQGSKCQSCWAFAVSTCMSARVALMTGNKVHTLSAQQLLSCSKASGGCAIGAHPEEAIQFAIKQGLVRETDLPYSGEASTCPLIPKDTPRVYARPGSGRSICERLPPVKQEATIARNVDRMMREISGRGPFCGTLELTQSIYKYKGGVYKCAKGEKSDGQHAVAIVGYDTTASTPYWLIQNSWGPNWGERGYIRVAMGQNCSSVEARASSVEVDFERSMLTKNPYSE